MTLDAMRRPLAWGFLLVGLACSGYGAFGGPPGWAVVGGGLVLLGLAVCPPEPRPVEWEDAW